MGMTTLLTLTAMFGAVRQSVPRVSYVSLLDVWMLACILFVFSAILEFVVVSRLLRRNDKERADRAEKAGRAIVAALFLVFNLIYWLSLIFISIYQNP